jgi:hypothetical protein
VGRQLRRNPEDSLDCPFSSRQCTGGIRYGDSTFFALVQAVFLFELSGCIGLGQVAEVLVGQRVEFVLEQLLGTVPVLVVELDADVAREA